MESFRTPNFELVADILLWLVKNYDPSIDISDDISTEQDRIIFIKSIATFMAPKAHVKLNTRKLYMADGYAVKELLKIATILYEASTTKYTDDEDVMTIPPLDITNRLSQLKTCRLLASEITEKGATLYDLLGKETELRDIRTAIISRPFDLRTMEAAITDSIGKLQEQILATRGGLENLAADETNLMAKIDKKKVELERAEKRLKSLQGVRPAYMDEYEKIEVDLGRLYETYMEKFRNLTYLEQQLDEHNRLEQDKFEETEVSLKRMQTRLREEELRLLRGDKEMRAVVGSYGGGAESARPKRPNEFTQFSHSPSSWVLEQPQELAGDLKLGTNRAIASQIRNPKVAVEESLSIGSGISPSDDGNDDDILLDDDDRGKEMDDMDDPEDDDRIAMDDDEGEDGSLGDGDRLGSGGLSDDNDF
ncbi:Clusterin-associated protein 1 [Borealophlyctis nickersoniae]|nr:Clusterin-associated protein 1 [Borealophlyctis nickersoniae]